VAGGASAAARARRLSEDAHIVLFERGPDVSFANCGLPYYVGGEIAERETLLVTTPDRLRSRFNLDVRIRSSVEAIDRTAKSVRVRELATGREYEEPYDKLILAPGAAPLRPPIPGIDLPGIFTLRNLHDVDRIKECVVSWSSESFVDICHPISSAFQSSGTSLQSVITNKACIAGLLLASDVNRSVSDK
jgi:NADPH-dependent 2,4-dienoyl-CoA reductase/sulfur reductase-like enzyme